MSPESANQFRETFISGPWPNKMFVRIAWHGQMPRHGARTVVFVGKWRCPLHGSY